MTILNESGFHNFNGILEPTTEQMEKIIEDNKTDGSVLFLYFAAYWAPPCIKFASKINDIFKEIVKEIPKVNFYLMSLDKEKDKFLKFVGEMRNIAIDSNIFESKMIQDMVEKFKVEGIPCLIVLINGEADDNGYEDFILKNNGVIKYYQDKLNVK